MSYKKIDLLKALNDIQYQPSRFINMASKGFILFSNKMKPLVYLDMREIHMILKTTNDTKSILKKRINESTENAILDMWDELLAKERSKYDTKQ